jgi:hypothetical protein
MALPPLLNPYGDLFVELMNAEIDPPALAAIRKKLIWAYSWAVPSREAIAEIARHSPLIEIGAGTGYWAWLLAQAGADVLAYDRNAPAPPHWAEVREGGPEVIERWSERSLFLCWPPLDDSLAAGCLARYRGEVVLHVGELGEGARTGDSNFQRRLLEEFALEREVALPGWPGYADRLTVWRRKEI